MRKALHRCAVGALASGVLISCATKPVPQTTTARTDKAARGGMVVPPPTAPSGTADGNALHDFECDAPAGYYSGPSKTISGLPLSISGEFQVKELKQDPNNWMPVVSVYTDSADDRHIGFRMIRRSATDYAFTVEMDDSRSTTEGTVIGSIPVTQGLTHFSFELAADSTMRVRVGSLSGTERLKAVKPVTAELGCSSVDVHFSNVVISRSLTP